MSLSSSKEPSLSAPNPAFVASGPRLPDEAELHETFICPRSGWVPVDWAELYRGRELLFFLVWRDVKVRYKQTVLGVAWAALQPLLTLVVFTVIFGRYAGIPSEGFPYPVFAFAALLPWTFFANGVAQAGQSLVSQQQLLTKVYFPRVFIPTATVGAFLLDFAISLVLFALLMAGYRVVPSWQVVFVPFLIALTVMATLGMGYLLAALTVFYRDFRYVVPFLIQILMFLSPVIYPLNILPTPYRWFLALNPMAGVIEAYRSAILGTPWDLPALAISSVVCFVLFMTGLSYFRKVERWFADFA